MDPVTLLTIIQAGVKLAGTLQSLRAIAAQHGATPEQLALMDVRLSDAIASREADLNPPQP